MTDRKLKNKLLILGGTLAVVMGVIGIFLPVLPTTPFLLLAAFCYVRSSPRLYRALLNNRVFGSYLKNYLEGRGMALKFKVLTISLLWLLIGATVIFLTDSLVLRIVLGVVAVGVTVHLLCVKTLHPERVEKTVPEEKYPLSD